MTLLSHIKAGLVSLMLVAALLVSFAVSAASTHDCCGNMPMDLTVAAAGPCQEHAGVGQPAPAPGKSAKQACDLHCASLPVTAALLPPGITSAGAPTHDVQPLPQPDDSVSGAPAEHTPPPPRFA